MDIPIEKRIDTLIEAGIPHRKDKDKLGRVVHVFRTSDGTEQERNRSQLVWSILREKCLITKYWGSGRTWNDLETRVPTSYFYRLLHDDGERKRGSGWALFVLTFLFAALPPVTILGISSFGDFVAFVIIPLLVWIGLYVWFRSQIVFSGVVAPKHVLGRFFLGAIFGGVWLLVTGMAFSLTYASGAFWLFTVSNVVWIVTIDLDRWLFVRQAERVGGLLPYQEALSRLQSSTTTDSQS